MKAAASVRSTDMRPLSRRRTVGILAVSDELYGPAMRAIGIDVGSRALHAVAMDAARAVLEARVFAPSELGELAAWASQAAVAAIDAPDGPSTGAHAIDHEVAPKFRAGRCGEVALGRQRGYWVPWVTPAEPAAGSWMDVGIRVHGALRDAGMETIEVFPNAGFRELAGGARLEPKTTAAGLRRRAALLRASGVRDAGAQMRSHDELDASLAALVALQRTEGRAVRVGCPDDAACERDGSAIWLPAALIARRT
jgi:predicted nuclease with RNAse H fold